MSDKKLKALQRVLDHAAKAVAEGTFHTVSVNEIAELAHCSTATIYEVYGNKENLFLAALSHTLQSMERPRFQAQESGCPLERLLSYTEARARWLAGTKQRKISRSVVAPNDRMRHLVSEDLRNEALYTVEVLSLTIQSSMNAGLLRPLEPETVVYNIMAGTIYEPLVFGLIFGEETPVHYAHMLRHVFTPLVTAKGRQVLEKFLQHMATAGV
jgi:AcrR family transcriptional regulator